MTIGQHFINLCSHSPAIIRTHLTCNQTNGGPECEGTHRPPRVSLANLSWFSLRCGRTLGVSAQLRQWEAEGWQSSEDFSSAQMLPTVPAHFFPCPGRGLQFLWMGNSNLYDFLHFPLRFLISRPVITTKILSLSLVAQKVVCLVVRGGLGREDAKPSQALRNSLVSTGLPIAGHSEPSPSC